MTRKLVLAAVLCGCTCANGCYVADTVMQGRKAMKDVEALTPEVEKRNKEVNELANPTAAPAEAPATP